MGLKDAFVQLGVVTPQNCQMTKNPKLKKKWKTLTSWAIKYKQGVR